MEEIPRASYTSSKEYPETYITISIVRDVPHRGVIVYVDDAVRQIFSNVLAHALVAVISNISGIDLF